MFGVGPYTFAPWKVAVSGLYKHLTFALLGPQEGRPVVLDDTCYFVSFTTEEAARAALQALQSTEARDFFRITHLLGREAPDPQSAPPVPRPPRPDRPPRRERRRGPRYLT